MQFPRMTAAESLVPRKLKIKIGSKGVRVVSDKESSDNDAHMITHDGCISNFSMNEKSNSDMNFNVNLPLQRQAKRRGPVAVLDGQMDKRRKIDRSVKQQCANILKDLQNHKFGWPFNQPVDPVALNIPDYFSLIKNPMDLGTIESKLEKNVYLSVDEFAADVRLTFSNCMLYNPPYNDYHAMAKALKNIFERKWKLLVKKVNRESEDVLRHCISDRDGEVTRGTLQMQYKLFPANVDPLSGKTMPLEEKQKLRKELKELLRGKMTEDLLNTLKKFNLHSLKGMIDKDIDGIDDEILWDLKRMVKSSLKISAEKSGPAKVTQSGHHSLTGKVFNKGMDCGSKFSCESGDVKAPASSVNSICSSCGSLTCLCSLRSSKVQSYSCLTSETETKQGHDGVSTADCCSEIMAASCLKRLEAESNGAGRMAEATVSISPDLAVCGSTIMSSEEWTPVVDVQLSPKKALRAAMLKSRFADTIFKARTSTLLDHGDKADSVKLQREKDRLEKQQREEKARIEAQIVAAEAASRLRVQAELKMQREREREASRIALQQMEKTVEIDDNLKFLKDLVIISQSSESDCPLGYSPGNPLERLGLYIKDDFREDDDDEEALLSDDDGSEEGEIL